MTHAIEKITKDLKGTREKKGLSQRELSKLINVPQSHISKIENGGVDLRVSSLIEIARALDLELELVPRKNLSAVRTITKTRVSAKKNLADLTKVAKEIQLLQDTTAKILRKHSAIKQVAQFQRRVKDLDRFQIPNSAFDEIRKINSSLNTFVKEPENLHTLNESLKQLQHLRNQLTHSQLDLPTVEKIRSAYSLEDDEYE